MGPREDERALVGWSCGGLGGFTRFGGGILTLGRLAVKLPFGNKEPGKALCEPPNLKNRNVDKT